MNRRSQRLAGLAVFAILLAVAPNAQAAEPGQIIGTVTNASTAEPINDVKVCAVEAYVRGGSSGCAGTEPNGQYTIAGLKAGEYRVEFYARGSNYLPQYYDGKALSSEAQLVSVAAGQATPGVDAELQEGARITGNVTDASTREAITGIQVCAISATTGEAWCGSSVGLSGEYEILQIPTGKYRIRFSPPFESEMNYFPQFYDGKSSSSEAQVLSVTAGSLTSNIDAELQEGGRIKGVVRDASTKVALQNIQVCASEANNENQTCTKTNELGEYTVQGLASGEYKVAFYPAGLDYLVGETTASATAGATTSEVDMELTKGGEVTGTVTDAATRQAIQYVQVCARNAGSKPRTEENCTTSGSRGEYTISRMASGEYEITFSPSVFENLDYFFYDGPTVTVTAGETTPGIDAELTEGGRMTGRVTDASTGEPIEGVEACARETRGDGSQCEATNASGEYTILRLSGEYRIEFRAQSGNYLAEFYGDRSSFAEPEALPVSVTAPGTTSGIDIALQPGRFTEPVNTAAPVISGTAAAGDALSCSSGSWTGNPAPTFAYRWLRDGTWIPGATESSYTAQATDAGHSLSCEVYATNIAGNTVGTEHALSAGVTIATVSSIGSPSGGSTAPPLSTAPSASLSDSTLPIVATPLVTLTARKLVVSDGSAPVHIACSQATCHGSIELTTYDLTLKQGKTASRNAALVLAKGSFSVAKGRSRTIVLHLTAAGRKILAHANKRHPIAATLVLFLKGVKAITKSVLAI
jgi:molybdopterin-binding protein